MIDATYPKVSRTALSLRVKKGGLAADRTYQGAMNTKLHAVAEVNGRPLSFFMTAGKVSDCSCEAARLDDMPKAQWLLGRPRL